MRKIYNMYALLLAAAVLVVGSIWFACSADDEFESNYEMETLAKGELLTSLEPQTIIYNQHTSSMNTTAIFTFTGNDADSCSISFQLDCDDSHDHFKMTILSYEAGNPGYMVQGYIDKYKLINGTYKFYLIFCAQMTINNTPFDSNRVSKIIYKTEEDFN